MTRQKEQEDWAEEKKKKERGKKEEEKKRSEEIDRKGESNDSPEIPDRKMTSDIPGHHSGPADRKLKGNNNV